MSDLLEKCEEYFGSRDFYEVLKIRSNSSSKEIKKAYYKLSLLVHPDRVEDSKKDVFTEKFKLLGKIHSILQDSDKRKIYDECGTIDEDTDILTNWLSYWRNMFKKISTEDIENYKKEYLGSDTEKYDIKKAYIASKGDMNHIFEMVPFSNCENESRIIEVVREMVDNGEVEEFESFFNEAPRKKKQRQQKEEREKRKSERIVISDNELADQIHNRQIQRMDSLLGKLEAKYGSGKKRKSIKNGVDDIPVKRRTRSMK